MSVFCCCCLTPVGRTCRIEFFIFFFKWDGIECVYVTFLVCGPFHKKQTKQTNKKEEIGFSDAISHDMVSCLSGYDMLSTEECRRRCQCVWVSGVFPRPECVGLWRVLFHVSGRGVPIPLCDVDATSLRHRSSPRRLEHVSRSIFARWGLSSGARILRSRRCHWTRETTADGKTLKERTTRSNCVTLWQFLKFF